MQAPPNFPGPPLPEGEEVKAACVEPGEGRGGAPIAERFGPEWMVTVLTGIAYISISLLAVATLLIGGLFFYHGFLTLIGRSPGTIIEEDRERLAAQPVIKPKVVDEPQPGES